MYERNGALLFGYCLFGILVNLESVKLGIMKL